MAEGDDLTMARSALVGQIASRKETITEQKVTSESPEANGPRERTEADYPNLQDWRLRRAAIKEYNRTIQEFRRTGMVADKEWGDFAHLINPPSLQFHVFHAHCEASLEIDRWHDEQAKAQREREPEKAWLAEPTAQADAGLQNADEEKGEPENDEDGEVEIPRQSGAFFAEALHGTKGCLTALKNRAAVAEQPLPVVPARASEQTKTVGLLRGIAFDPDLPGRNARFEPAIPQLDVAAPPERLPDLDDQTESLLNAMIGECHFLMREVAFPSMCHAGVADDRLHWLGKAMDLAKTGATVAKAVARLRHGPAVRESHQKITVENKVAVVQGGGG